MSDQLQAAYENAAKAVDELRVAAGVDLVNQMEVSGQLSILHGGLSAMACQIDGAAGTYAQLVLEAAGLDPLSSIPPNVPVFMGMGKDLEKLEGGIRDKLALTEPLHQIDRSVLIGTIIMMQSIGNMVVARRPKVSRSAIVDKIDMAIESCIRSFGVTQEQVDQAREGNQDFD